MLELGTSLWIFGGDEDHEIWGPSPLNFPEKYTMEPQVFVLRLALVSHLVRPCAAPVPRFSF